MLPADGLPERGATLVMSERSGIEIAIARPGRGGARSRGGRARQDHRTQRPESAQALPQAAPGGGRRKAISHRRPSTSHQPPQHHGARQHQPYRGNDQYDTAHKRRKASSRNCSLGDAVAAQSDLRASLIGELG